jgi:hypothetical protein
MVVGDGRDGPDGRALGRDLTWEELPGHPEIVTTTVRDVAGAPAHAFADWAAANADAFR